MYYIKRYLFRLVLLSSLLFTPFLIDALVTQDIGKDSSSEKEITQRYRGRGYHRGHRGYSRRRYRGYRRYPRHYYYGRDGFYYRSYPRGRYYRRYYYNDPYYYYYNNGGSIYFYWGI